MNQYNTTKSSDMIRYDRNWYDTIGIGKYNMNQYDTIRIDTKGYKSVRYDANE